jgi:NADH:ubiquinone reductase (H+-translocating)
MTDAAPPIMDAAHRVVVVGSGFGGLFAVRALRGAAVSVTVIDRANHHLFQPLLYQVATGILPEGEVAPAIRDVLRHHRQVSVHLAEVTSIDLDRRVVIATQPGHQSETPYDSLILATGMQTSYFGHDEFARFAPGLKSIDDALELRGRIFDAFEMAETEPDPEARRAWLTFVVVGGGPTGVEMAGQIVELSRRALTGNFRSIDPASARVLLVEGTDKVLGGFGDRLGVMARRKLESMGVEVRTGCMVTGIDDMGVDIRTPDGTTVRVAARTRVWAAGMSVTPLVRQVATAAGVATDRAGRIHVDDDCTLPGHPEVFVVGDIMSLRDLPGVAEVAIQSGVHAARTIRSRLAGDQAKRPFRYRDLGTVASIARFSAVVRLGPVSFGGMAGWLVWLVVHLTFLTGFKNRLGALAHWGIAFVGHSRAERVITRQQIEARTALAARSQAAVNSQGPPANRLHAQVTTVQPGAADLDAPTGRSAGHDGNAQLTGDGTD